MLVFPGVSGDSFSLIAQPAIGGTPRAPIIAIELSPILLPEPSSVLLAVLGLLSRLGLRRRR